MTRSRRRKLAREQGLSDQTVLRRSVPVAATLLAAMPGAYAADQADTGEAGGLQEVVVTAQKRVENLQDVPISVQVFDSQKLDQLGIVNLDDYVKFSPSISYVRGQGEGGNGETGRSPPSTGRSPFTSTTSSASKCWRDPRALCSARVPSPGRCASSATSPPRPSSPPATMCRATGWTTAAPAGKPKASSISRCPHSLPSASSAWANTTPDTSEMWPGRTPARASSTACAPSPPGPVRPPSRSPARRWGGSGPVPSPMLPG